MGKMGATTFYPELVHSALAAISLHFICTEAWSHERLHVEFKTPGVFPTRGLREIPDAFLAVITPLLAAVDFALYSTCGSHHP
jgi:hypothetical protein